MSPRCLRFQKRSMPFFRTGQGAPLTFLLLFCLFPLLSSSDTEDPDRHDGRCESEAKVRSWDSAPSFDSTRFSSSESPQELLEFFLSEVAAGRDGRGVGGGKRGASCPPCQEGATCCEGCGCHHGECGQAGSCICHGDWFGDACDTNPMLHASFLPEVHPSAGGRRRSEQAKAFSDHSLEVVRALDALQHRHSCGVGAGGGGDVNSGCSVQVVASERKGLGAWIHHLAGALTSGQTQNSTVVVRFPNDYFLHDGCPRLEEDMEQEDGSCMFEPFVSGVEEALLRSARAVESMRTLQDYWSSYLPPPEHAAHGILSWSSNVVQYIATPNRRLSALIRRYKSLLGWPEGPVVGVHVRRGDACAAFRRGKMHHSELMPRAFCVNVQRDVLPAIEIMVKTYNFSQVFVSTDDPKVLDDLTESKGILPQGSKVRYFGLESHRSFLRSDTNYDIALRLGVMDRRMTSESALLDLHLLAECDCLIAQLSGEYSRTAFELSVAQKAFLPPFISLDTYPWAPRYGLANLPYWWQYSEPIALMDLVHWKDRDQEGNKDDN